MGEEPLPARAAPLPRFEREEVALGDGRRLLLFSLLPGPARAAPEPPPTPPAEPVGT